MQQKCDRILDKVHTAKWYENKKLCNKKLDYHRIDTVRLKKVISIVSQIQQNVLVFVFYSKIKVLVKCRPLNFKEEAFNLKNNNDIIEISKN